MNTSAHVSLDTKKKIENLMIATRELIIQLRSEEKQISADALAEAHHYMGLAANRHGGIDTTKERSND